MTRRGGDDRGLINQVFGTELAQESTDEGDRDARPVTMRSVERAEVGAPPACGGEPDNWDDREQWLRENVPPHHI
jgi:hypothetical protein